MPGFDETVQELYRVPLSQFVAERKRLADELKRSGDASGAKQLLARRRPTISAWVVNQLYWHARDAFDELLATAERLREGDLGASPAHRAAITKLRERAARIIEDAGHSASEATLRRVALTLSAIAAAGGFEPDLPGTIAEDRDAPGFEAVGIPAEPAPPAARRDGHDGHARAPTDRKDELAKARRTADKDRKAEEARQRAEEMAARKRAEEKRKRIAAERHRLEVALRTARAEHAEREREVRQLASQLAVAEESVERAKGVIAGLEQALADLDSEAN